MGGVERGAGGYPQHSITGSAESYKQVVVSVCRPDYAGLVKVCL